MEYNEVINNSQYIKIANSAIKKFKCIIDKDELNQCKHIGIWKACLSFKPGKSSFITHLYNHVKWECCKLLNSNSVVTTNGSPKNLHYDNYLLLEIRDCLSDREYSLFERKFVLGKTFKEIATEEKTNIKRIRRYISKIILEIKKQYD